MRDCLISFLKTLLLACALIFLRLEGNAQFVELKKNPDLKTQVQAAITKLYAWEFKAADSLITILSPKLGDHPVVPFLSALKVYWKGAPINFSGESFEQYWKFVQQADAKADSLWEHHEDDPELAYFRLIFKLIKAQYYDKSGETMAAVSATRQAYSLIKFGFEAVEDFPEFIFTNGLYNFYREAYPERFPMYKPFAWFFQSGDRELGLQQLEETAEKSVFSGIEASRFLAFIYRVYENKPKKAVYFARLVYERFPNNHLLLKEYIEALVLNGFYEEGYRYIELLESESTDPYFKMAVLTFKGMLAEFDKKNISLAFDYYREAEMMLRDQQPKGRFLKTYIFSGLSSYYKATGEKKSKARHYHKLAKKYDFNEYMHGREDEG